MVIISDAAKSGSWTVAEAKARFSEVIDKARHQGPQAITRHGKSAVVVVDAMQWEQSLQRERQGSFANFLRASPLRGSGLETERLESGVREIDL
ncbi:MAG: type II toxin-antitoxin system Phd/YefM family antitoxin [Sphingomonadales bacterium]|nr:MAG: type II toxin-antitoxin system Phd/YefM family antitoxin [Sphingomonadales bacterium]